MLTAKVVCVVSGTSFWTSFWGRVGLFASFSATRRLQGRIGRRRCRRHAGDGSVCQGVQGGFASGRCRCGARPPPEPVPRPARLASGAHGRQGVGSGPDRGPATSIGGNEVAGPSIHEATTAIPELAEKTPCLCTDNLGRKESNSRRWTAAWPRVCAKMAFSSSWQGCCVLSHSKFDGGQSDADCLTPQLHQRPSGNGTRTQPAQIHCWLQRILRTASLGSMGFRCGDHYARHAAGGDREAEPADAAGMEGLECSSPPSRGCADTAVQTWCAILGLNQ